MKFIVMSLLFAALVLNLQAGKVTWKDDGTIIIVGTEGKGCSEDSFTVEDKNTTQPNCS